MESLAPADLIPDPYFSPLTVSQQEPPAPDKNCFQVGMKLEAVDRKNPHFICPATVGALRGVEVLVTFDGWRGAFDYYCRYDSRDIFPVGWCSLTGDNLQPPGTKGLKNISLSFCYIWCSEGSGWLWSHIKYSIALTCSHIFFFITFYIFIGPCDVCDHGIAELANKKRISTN